MEEAQRLCDRVAIVDHGEVVSIGTVDELIESHGGPQTVTVQFLDNATVPGEWREEIEDGYLHRQSSQPFEVIDEIRASGAGIRSLDVKRPTLEDVFLNLTGRSLRDS
jgi:ABC-2 type transport system ATP-binding protein